MASPAEVLRSTIRGEGHSFTPKPQAPSARDLYAKVSHAVPAIEWPVYAAEIDAIMTLKRTRNAVVLAHNYQTPEIFHCVSDIVGDSLALAREAMTVDADVIVLAGVHFMAETAKLLNPSKTVLIPDLGAGCSLADSITPADVRRLRAAYPGVPVVTYVNTSAAVKAESDICCTSGNAKAVVESLGVDRVIMLPDEFLARNIAAQTDVKIISWSGHCEVHELFTAQEVRDLREDYPGVVVLAHPECAPEVVAEADFSGSTAAMQAYVARERPAKLVLLTECSMSDNVAVLHPDLDFVRPCNLCPHMKKITLRNIRRSLETMQHAVEIDPSVADRARLAVERMLAVK
ncbi:quinolinate synthetase complex, A subunit [Methylocella silvestris BL2]|uniref:Quinolinate synthase n=1 Tax=Methylocella silvestris (strain DSM 15510 / CIP 108128 / LMG 27833 / NCIMB 13906 / BL2) TaxID=395965 RepID=B8EP36_METSB|nr:quinolinate synthase NadA [Methylocella silvestris]ACK49274.1 quinolinate synthetase complex, A subunit [Methylocella silvestris BL2]